MVEMLDKMRMDSARKNKRGIAFIIASIFLWLGIFLVHSTDLSIREKNLYTWYVTGCLMPFALLITKMLKIKFQNKENPINQLGLLITLNEMLYILIACWVCTAIPEKMVMVLAMIFGGHLLPFGWIYMSKSYTFSAIVITVGILVVGCVCSAKVVAGVMMFYEIIFAICLWLENKNTSTVFDL